MTKIAPLHSSLGNRAKLCLKNKQTKNNPKALTDTLQRRYIDGKYTYEKLLHIIRHKKMQIKMRQNSTPTKMAKIQNTINI